MLVRLGLRTGEIVALEFGNFDWRAGEIIVRGKGNRRERMPLPVDVGRAVVDYLQAARLANDCRNVFLRTRAPHRALTSSGVSQIVMSAARKAGLPPVGGHRLRHTAATEMLRAGAPLMEIGQVLRQAATAYPDGPYGELLAGLSAGQRPLDLLKLRIGMMWEF